MSSTHLLNLEDAQHVCCVLVGGDTESLCAFAKNSAVRQIAEFEFEFFSLNYRERKKKNHLVLVVSDETKNTARVQNPFIRCTTASPLAKQRNIRM